MPRHMKRWPLFCLLAVTLMLFSATQSRPTMAQATSTTTNTQMPFTATLTDCNGQPVVVSGVMHQVTHFTTSANGGTHAHINNNWQNASGVSGTTTYRAVSNNHHHFNSNGSQSEFTTIDDVLLISAGPLDNLRIRVHMHATVNANGEVTSSFVRFEVVCNG